MTIGQLEDELCLVGADSMTVKAVTLSHASKEREFQSEQVTVADHGGQAFWKQHVRF